MKRGTPDTTKLRQLSRALDIPQYAAVGLLELLWHRVANESPQGNVGRQSNDDIALSLDWRGDADELIAALVKWKWLDRDPEHRLIVHDWAEHCEDATHCKLARKRERFADGTVPRLNRLSKAERGPLEAFYAREVAQKGHPSARLADPSAQDARSGALPTPTPTPRPVGSSSEGKARRIEGGALEPVAQVIGATVAARGIQVQRQPEPVPDLEAELDYLRQAIKLHAQLTGARFGNEDPPKDVLLDCLKQARGLSAGEIQTLVLDPLRRDGFGPQESWRWYPTVIGKRSKIACMERRGGPRNLRW